MNLLAPVSESEVENTDAEEDDKNPWMIEQER